MGQLIVLHLFANNCANATATLTFCQSFPDNLYLNCLHLLSPFCCNDATTSRFPSTSSQEPAFSSQHQREREHEFESQSPYYTQHAYYTSQEYVEEASSEVGHK